MLTLLVLLMTKNNCRDAVAQAYWLGKRLRILGELTEEGWCEEED